MLRLSAGISIHGIATEDFTINLGNKDCEVLFDIFGLFRQTARQQGIKRKLIFLLSELVTATFPFKTVVSATQ